MYKQIREYLKSIVQALIVFCILSALMDWYRQPAQPPISPSQTLITLSNQPVTLNDFSRNRISLLYFWGSWCGICRYTSSSVEALHQDGIPVISIALKSGSDREITTYMQNHGMHFQTVNDSDSLIANQWQISATPTIIFIKDGQMISSTTGISSYWGLRGKIWLKNLLG